MTDKIGVASALDGLDGWNAVDGPRDAIQKSFTFDDFKLAWAFMSASALQAEQMDHHPEWFNVYSRVDVVLTTHDVDGVSRKDVELARFMDRVASRIQN